MEIQREVADRYQGLFNLMSKEYNLILTISEMDEIVHQAQKLLGQDTNHKLDNSLGVHHCGNELTDKEIFHDHCLRCEEQISDD